MTTLCVQNDLPMANKTVLFFGIFKNIQAKIPFFEEVNPLEFRPLGGHFEGIIRSYDML